MPRKVSLTKDRRSFHLTLRNFWATCTVQALALEIADCRFAKDDTSFEVLRRNSPALARKRKQLKPGLWANRKFFTFWKAVNDEVIASYVVNLVVLSFVFGVSLLKKSIQIIADARHKRRYLTVEISDLIRLVDACIGHHFGEPLHVKNQRVCTGDKCVRTSTIHHSWQHPALVAQN